MCDRAGRRLREKGGEKEKKLIIPPPKGREGEHLQTISSLERKGREGKSLSPSSIDEGEREKDLCQSVVSRLG